MSDYIKKQKIWYVLYTKRRKEFKVIEELSKIGIDAYTPIKVERKKWSDRIKKVKVCLLPSMVLISLNEKNINSVFKINYIKRYLFVNGKRAKILNREVKAMQEYINDKYIIKYKKNIKIGDKIKVNLLHQEATIINKKGKRCFAQLEMLGAQISFNIS